MDKSTQLFSIGNVSKITGLSIESLRYYHKEGILVPAYINEKSGYRYYSINQFNQISLIKKFRELGISIEELRKIFESAQTQDLLNYLNQVEEQMKSQIAQLELKLEKLATLEYRINRSLQVMKDDELSILEIPKRFLLKLPIKNASEELIGYQHLANLAKTYAIEEIGKGLFLESDHTGNLSPSYNFFLIKEENFNLNDDSFSILPAGKYLTVSFDKKNENEKTLLFKQYIAEHNLPIENGIHKELFFDASNLNTYVCQLQLCIEEYDEC